MTNDDDPLRDAHISIGKAIAELKALGVTVEYRDLIKIGIAKIEESYGVWSDCGQLHCLSHHANRMSGDPQLRLFGQQGVKLAQQCTLKARVHMSVWLIDAVDRIWQCPALDDHIEHEVEGRFLTTR